MDIFLPVHTIEVDFMIRHFRPYWFKFTNIVYADDIETTVEVQFVDLIDNLLNVLHFWFLIILLVVNSISWDGVFRNPMPLMLMRLQHKLTLLYLSRIPYGTFGTTISPHV